MERREGYKREMLREKKRCIIYRPHFMCFMGKMNKQENIQTNNNNKKTEMYVVKKTTRIKSKTSVCFMFFKCKMDKIKLNECPIPSLRTKITGLIVNSMDGFFSISI